MNNLIVGHVSERCMLTNASGWHFISQRIWCIRCFSFRLTYKTYVLTYDLGQWYKFGWNTPPDADLINRLEHRNYTNDIGYSPSTKHVLTYDRCLKVLLSLARSIPLCHALLPQYLYALSWNTHQHHSASGKYMTMREKIIQCNDLHLHKTDINIMFSLKMNDFAQTMS